MRFRNSSRKFYLTVCAARPSFFTIQTVRSEVIKMSKDKSTASFNEVVQASEAVLNLLNIIPDVDYVDKTAALGMAIAKVFREVPSGRRDDIVADFIVTLKNCAALK